MNRYDDQSIKEALASCLSGVEALPSQRADILRAAKGEKKMKRKMNLGLILALILVLLSTSVAMAAELGLFGQLSQQWEPDPRLSGLDAAATPAELVFTTGNGVTITVQQTYYDGSRVFISYKMTGPIESIELGEGKPPHMVNYDYDEPGVIFSQTYHDASPIGLQLTHWLDGSLPRWAKTIRVNTSDNLDLQDGTTLNIIGGDFYQQADGSYIGWKECIVPEDKTADEITVVLRVSTNEHTYYQTPDCLYHGYGNLSREAFSFTVKRDTSIVALAGSMQTDTYTAAADITVTSVDMKGEVIISCPDPWLSYWNDWDFYDPGLDLIRQYVLYIGDTRVDDWNIDGSVGTRGTDTVRYGICYQLDGMTEGLKLVPVYRNSGEHPDEAIILTVEGE